MQVFDSEMKRHSKVHLDLSYELVGQMVKVKRSISGAADVLTAPGGISYPS